MDTRKLSRRSVLLAAAGVMSTSVASGQNASEDANDTGAESGGNQEPGGEHSPGLRVTNVAPDVPAINVFVDGEPYVEDLSHLDPHVDTLPALEETATVSAELPNGSFPEGAQTEARIPVQESPPLGGWTVFFVGEQCGVTSSSFRPVVVPDNHAPTPSGMSRITGMHFAPDVPTANVRAGDGTMLFEEVEFGDWETMLIPAVDSTVTIETAEDGTEIDSFEIFPEEGTVYSASLTGYQDPENAPALASENPPPGRDDWSLGLAISEDANVGVEDDEQNQDESET